MWFHYISEHSAGYGADKEIRGIIWMQPPSSLSAIWDEKPLLYDCSSQRVGEPQIQSPLSLKCVGFVLGATGDSQVPAGSPPFTIFVSTHTHIYKYIYREYL